MKITVFILFYRVPVPGSISGSMNCLSSLHAIDAFLDLKNAEAKRKEKDSIDYYIVPKEFEIKSKRSKIFAVISFFKINLEQKINTYVHELFQIKADAQKCRSKLGKMFTVGEQKNRMVDIQELIIQ